MRSDTVKKGIQQAPHRSLFNALGLTEEELDRPLIGVVSSYNEIVPGHMNLDKITEAVKLGVAMAGGTPIMVPAIAVCDGIAMGHIGMKYSLVTRDLIADSTEALAMAHQFDGLVMIPNCDKNVPRYILVTVWDHYKSVKLMCHSKSFCRICDQISCYERIFHTDMSHSNTITDSNSRNHDWCSSGHCHAKFNCFCDLIQIHVPRYNLIIRTYNTDQWTI